MSELWVPGQGNASTPQARLSSFGQRHASDVQATREQMLREGKAVEDGDVIREMRHNRSINKKGVAGMGGGGTSAQFSFATGRPRDPMFYWKENNLPYDIAKDEELAKIRAFCRLLYITHPVIASAIDIFAKWPILGMEFTCKDDQLTDFYSDLFFEQLDYEEFLIDVGREYWTVGEAWPIGSFSETLGVWEADELVNPDDVKVIRSPFLKEPRFEMKVPEVIRNIIKNREPKWEYEALMRIHPEFAKFQSEDSFMPVSSILLKQMKFKGDSFHPRGIPILMRGFRAIIQEEMLNAAMDSVAERLYTPMVVAKIGASASDLGTQVPWIPNQDDLASFEDALDAALAGDFRVLITHFATDIEPVFGKEMLPDATEDFNRLMDRQLQVFGLSRTMLSGAGEGETYAADALNRDLVTQLLGRYQKMVKRFLKDRMLVVAEAQEHYDYEERGGIKYPIMEEILERDEETGEDRIIEQPKLLVPEIKCKVMNMADESEDQQFKEALRESGVPISMKTRLINVPIDLEEEIEITRDEQVELAVAAQETRKQTYLALKSEGLPIPDDLRQDFEPKAMQRGQGNPMNQNTEEELLPSIGLDQPASTMALAPTDADVAAGDDDKDAPNSEQVINAVPVTTTPAPPPAPPRNRWNQSRPEESDEMRDKMPKDSSLARDDEGNVYGIEGPRHVGMRRYAHIDPDVPLEEQL